MWLLLPLLLLTAALFYFILNPSYERSLQAKFYFATGDYPRAYTLAKEAFELDGYNRMAATVMTQSQNALKFVDYINEAKGYSEQIAGIAAAESISDADRAKMKLICEVMMERFVKISPIHRDGRRVVLDKALLEEAQHYYEQFSTLHEKLTAAL
jgi:hypothetical protein